MKALVTGSNGFIGSFIVERLLERNYQVKCLVRKTSNLRWIKDLPVQFTYGDVTNFDTIVPAVKNVDFIFHSGGIVRARKKADFFLINSLGTKNFLEAVRQNNSKLKRFVYLSSQAAVGPSNDGVPITEKNEPNPISNYGRSKLQAEQIVSDYKKYFPVTIIRPPSVYGPRDDDILTIFKYIKSGIKPQIGKNEKKISIVHVEDLVRGIILAAENEKAVNETFFISNKDGCLWAEFDNLIAEVMGKKGVVVNVPGFLLDVVAFVSEKIARISGKAAIVNRDKALEMKQQNWLVDSSKAEKMLGFVNEIKIKEGLRQTYLWYQQQGWL